MKNITLTILMLASAWKGNCTIHTITTPGFTFSPATITIQEGDTIDFSIGGIHNVLEVSQTTWNANGNTPLPGGFSLPFGGGLLLPADLTVGTHFYVCMPHASQGMKGMIIVEPTTGIDADPLSAALSVFPNPSSGQVTLMLNHPVDAEPYTVEIYDLQGQRWYNAPRRELLENQALNFQLGSKGIYFVQVRNSKETYLRKLIIQ